MGLRNQLKLLLLGKRQLSISLRPPRIKVRENAPDEYSTLVNQMSIHNINFVYDVGANKGQFGKNLYRAGYHEQLISFEPTSEAYSCLEAEARQHKKWQVAPRSAVGSKAGEAKINISSNSHSSSLLSITAKALEGAPRAHYVNTENVPVVTLDETNYAPMEANAFLKIDTQGFELEVLKGATELLKKIHGVQLEMSLTPMYEGAPSFQELHDYINGFGFELWGLDPVFSDPKTRRLYQVDATFFRKA